MRIKIRGRSIITTIGTTLVGLSLSIMQPLGVSALSIGGPSDCDMNAMIHCGAHSTAVIQGVYRNGAYIQSVYSYFGISSSDINNLDSTVVLGHVGRGGDVYTNSGGTSVRVATGDITAGRQDMPGSTKVTSGSATFFVRPPSASFQQASLPAYISMVNGRFQFAIIASCGNAVKATPVTPAPKPTPAPTPTPTPTPTSTTNTTNTTTTVVTAPVQTQSQEQSVVVTASATPAPTPAPTTTTTTTTAAPVAATVLPNTGPAGVIGVFILASAGGFFGYRRWLTHRL